MKKILSLIIFLSFHLIHSQNSINQNGIQTSVTNEFSANSAQARRYEIAKVGFNSHHWQRGSYMVVELFQTYFSSGYEKYIIQIGYEEGAQNTSPNIYLVEARGLRRNAKISLGNITDLSTSRGGYINKTISIYADVRYYTRYKARITYMRNKVDIVSEDNQIQINETPIGIDIPDFIVPDVPNTSISSDSNLEVTGTGNHYFQNGNVGIGTTSPTEKLEINGLIKIKPASTEDNNSPGITMASNDDFLYNDEYINQYGFGFHGYQDGTTSFANPQNAYMSGHFGLDFFTGSQSRMRISRLGEVSIGTPTRQAGFRLAVNGSIRAKEIKVDTGWADFVFEDEYELPTLEEVENYINAEGHLQDIPSAAEVAQNGIFLGEMNSKLLQKIEELTLYTIAQEKKITNQEIRNQKLEEALQKQETINKQLKTNNQNLEVRLAKIEALLGEE
ncbi:hypothetical protein [Aquimarina sp. MMG016]|uniref:hypothetical protein n=1 Tax=Aquimarina sp. MMG016 TaxID=2822690 RepID=UPI001B3A0906|nr:hypothetical protein [Aquimarina sp. MMG016]MBQ4820850.1 hypothetical protein [Aquimarina sp. MMG016]